MSCKEYDHYGMGYLYGELEPGEKSFMEAHLCSCSFCAEELGRDRVVLARFESLPAFEPPALDRARLKAPHRFHLIFRNPFTAALAASFMLLVLGMAGMSPMPPAIMSTPVSDSTMLTWQDPDDNELLYVRQSVEATREIGISYYDIIKKLERREQEDTLSVLRTLESYNDEIQTLSREAAGF